MGFHIISGIRKDPEAESRQLEKMRKALSAWFRRRVPDPVEVDDLVQDSFLRFSQRDDADRIDDPEAYLFQVARSVLADRGRRRVVRHLDEHVALEADRDRTEDADALRQLLARERLDHVSRVLMTLPDKTRAIFVLRRIEGMRYAEIAQRFGISVSAVEKHMERAIKHLLLKAGGPA